MPRIPVHSIPSCSIVPAHFTGRIDGRWKFLTFLACARRGRGGPRSRIRTRTTMIRRQVRPPSNLRSHTKSSTPSAPYSILSPVRSFSPRGGYCGLSRAHPTAPLMCSLHQQLAPRCTHPSGLPFGHTYPDRGPRSLRVELLCSGM
ncbi:Rad51 family DNA repair protein [Histoplasma capsulatum G186AR]|uniref:Rad51 family DNA repair protein n=1 Tax=Ajellomyces capsulatus TaxID=5037 RepID=A0A8H7YDD5_AJECA|nr:Rad51 family DNA repair protein [Histoplasma capsulatum]QSS72261.1 Rad51 family DNA repair protein [Histoplasma capsulatum G186AR]